MFVSESAHSRSIAMLGVKRIKDMTSRLAVRIFSLALLATLALSVKTSAAPLLHENWNSGSIDPTKWVKSNTPNSTSSLYNLGGGDYSWYNVGNDQWSQNIYTTGTTVTQTRFNRGNNKRCTFQMWGYTDRFPTATFGGQYFHNAASINGPWHTNNSGGAHGGIEAGQSEWVNQPLRFEQASWDSGPKMSFQYRDAFMTRYGKGKSLWIRVWLGNTRGAFIEWSSDGGGTWYAEDDSNPGTRTAQAQGTGCLAEDTREVQFQPCFSNGVTTNPSPSNNNLALGFGTLRGNVFIDNILVEDDSNVLVGAPTIQDAFVINDTNGRIIDVVYDQAMGAHVADPAYYRISGAGKGSLAENPSSVTDLGGNRYRLQWNSGIAVYLGALRLVVDGVEDTNGLPLGLGAGGGAVDLVAVPVELSDFSVE